MLLQLLPKTNDETGNCPVSRNWNQLNGCLSSWLNQAVERNHAPPPSMRPSSPFPLGPQLCGEGPGSSRLKSGKTHFLGHVLKASLPCSASQAEANRPLNLLGDWFVNHSFPFVTFFKINLLGPAS